MAKKSSGQKRARPFWTVSFVTRDRHCFYCGKAATEFELVPFACRLCADSGCWPVGFPSTASATQLECCIMQQEQQQHDDAVNLVVGGEQATCLPVTTHVERAIAAADKVDSDEDSASLELVIS